MEHCSSCSLSSYPTMAFHYQADGLVNVMLTLKSLITGFPFIVIGGGTIATFTLLLNYFPRFFSGSNDDLDNSDDTEKKLCILETDLEISTTNRMMTLLDTDTKNKAVNLLKVGKENMTAKLFKLKTLMEQYERLHSHLQPLDAACKAGIELENGDELISYGNVKTPVLLFKAYNSGGRWKSVPTSTRITDRESLRTLFQLFQSGFSHPLIREDFDKPIFYKDKFTRYLWHSYSGYSFELDETIQRIKGLTTEILENKPS